MIPLSSWLADGCRPSVTRETPDNLVGQDHRQPPGGDTQNIDEKVRNEVQRVRLEAEAACQESLATAREELRRDQLAREAALAAQWSSRCSAVTAEAIATWKSGLLEAIGESLQTVLLPFLSKHAVDRAQAALFELVAVELADARDNILELRAPLSMHDELREILQQNGIHAALTEADGVELLTRHGNSRFEPLAAEWMDRVGAGES